MRCRSARELSPGRSHSVGTMYRLDGSGRALPRQERPSHSRWPMMCCPLGSQNHILDDRIRAGSRALRAAALLHSRCQS